MRNWLEWLHLDLVIYLFIVACIRQAKEALEEEARKQQKEEILQKKKERRSKEISAFLYSIISQVWRAAVCHRLLHNLSIQESSGSGRKSEIRVDDNGVPLAVIEKRREDAMKAKANRDRIKNAVSKRPSLIERHNQVKNHS